MKYMIEAQGLVKKYGDVVALDGLDLMVNGSRGRSRFRLAASTREAPPESRVACRWDSWGDMCGV